MFFEKTLIINFDIAEKIKTGGFKINLVKHKIWEAAFVSSTGFCVAKALGKISAKIIIKIAVIAVAEGRYFCPYSASTNAVTKPEERVFTKLVPINVALTISSFFSIRNEIRLFVFVLLFFIVLY